MKNIANFLPLYFGSPIIDSSDNNFIVCDSLDADYLKYLLDSKRLNDFKLCLRPLSALRPHEAEHFTLLCLNSPHAPKGFDPIEKDEIQINLVHNDGGLQLDDDVEIYIEVSCRCFDGYIAIMKDGRIGMADESDTPTREMEPVGDVYGKVHYLLSRGFDLFGLIESGFAIDKRSV